MLLLPFTYIHRGRRRSPGKRRKAGPRRQQQRKHLVCRYIYTLCIDVTIQHKQASPSSEADLTQLSASRCTTTLSHTAKAKKEESEDEAEEEEEMAVTEVSSLHMY